MQTILVTGAAGFIGYHLSRALIASGSFNVVGYDNLNDYYPVSLKQSRLAKLSALSATFTFIRGDLSDAAALNAVFERFSIDIVVNLAAQAGVRYSIENPRAYLDSNLIGFFNLIEACRAHPVSHLIYASSSSVYGDQHKTPFATSDMADKPVSLYAATKRSNELLAYSYSKLYKIPATGLRFFTVYGPFGRPDMAYFSFTKRILSGLPITVYNNGDMYRDFTYVDDIVRGILALIPLKPAPDDGGAPHALYNIGNNRPERLSRFIEVLEGALNKKAIIEYLPMQPGDVYQTFADISAFAKITGFAPATTIETGLTRFVAWYREYYS